MELWKLGLEGKHDPFQGDGGLFFRWDISKNKLKTKGILGELKGNGRYFGIGWEFPFEILGLTFEIAQRQISLVNNLSIITSSPFNWKTLLQASLRGANQWFAESKNRSAGKLSRTFWLKIPLLGKDHETDSHDDSGYKSGHQQFCRIYTMLKKTSENRLPRRIRSIGNHCQPTSGHSSATTAYFEASAKFGTNVAR